MVLLIKSVADASEQEVNNQLRIEVVHQVEKDPLWYIESISVVFKCNQAYFHAVLRTKHDASAGSLAHKLASFYFQEPVLLFKVLVASYIKVVRADGLKVHWAVGLSVDSRQVCHCLRPLLPLRLGNRLHDCNLLHFAVFLGWNLFFLSIDSRHDWHFRAEDVTLEHGQSV
jgi:hypothetical protein